MKAAFQQRDMDDEAVVPSSSSLVAHAYDREPDIASAPDSHRIAADGRVTGLAAACLQIGDAEDSQEPFAATLRELSLWNEMVRLNANRLHRVLSATDIGIARRLGRLGLVYGLRGVSMLAQDIYRVDLFAQMGVRMIELTGDGQSRLGARCFTTQDAGLTDFGCEVLYRSAMAGMAVDLSMAARKTRADAVQIAPRPIAVIRAGCNALVDHPRNLTDEELREVADHGGYVAFGRMPCMATGRAATIEDVVRHIEHAIDACGEDHVGIGIAGCDVPFEVMDGYMARFATYLEATRTGCTSAPAVQPDVPPLLTRFVGSASMEGVAEHLLRRGHSETRVDKMMGLNFERFARDAWAR